MDGGRDRPQGKPYAFGNAKVTRDALRGVFSSYGAGVGGRGEGMLREYGVLSFYITFPQLFSEQQ